MQCFLWTVFERHLNTLRKWKGLLALPPLPMPLGPLLGAEDPSRYATSLMGIEFVCVEGWFKKGDSKEATGSLCLYSFSMFGFVMAFPLKLSELKHWRFGKCCACLQLSHFLASSFSLCLTCAFLEAQPRAPGDEIKARKKTRQRGSLFGTELYMSFWAAPSEKVVFKNLS